MVHTSPELSTRLILGHVITFLLLSILIVTLFVISCNYLTFIVSIFSLVSYWKLSKANYFFNYDIITKFLSHQLLQIHGKFKLFEKYCLFSQHRLWLRF